MHVSAELFEILKSCLQRYQTTMQQLLEEHHQTNAINKTILNCINLKNQLKNPYSHFQFKLVIIISYLVLGYAPPDNPTGQSPPPQKKKEKKYVWSKFLWEEDKISVYIVETRLYMFLYGKVRISTSTSRSFIFISYILHTSFTYNIKFNIYR